MRQPYGGERSEAVHWTCSLMKSHLRSVRLSMATLKDECYTQQIVVATTRSWVFLLR